MNPPNNESLARGPDIVTNLHKNTMQLPARRIRKQHAQAVFWYSKPLQKASSTNEYLAFGRKKAKTDLTVIYHFWITSSKKFHKMRVNVNSNDNVWRASSVHASTAYSKIGIHFLRSKLKITCTEAQRPVLLKMALNARKNRHLAS